MKFLVLGCNGMAGNTISTYLSERGHDVTGFDRKASNTIKCVIGDARDTQTLAKIIEVGDFDSVINCIGILNQFAENDKALATFLNSYFPHFLANITKNSKTQIIHMSTDCVFSGKRGGYTESDFKDGESFYDRSKALGELDDEKNITLRNSIVGPDINPNGIGLLNWFMNSTSSIDKREIILKGFTKTMWTGQTTLQLAKTMEAAAKSHAHGLYNMVPDHLISKYELLQLFNKYFRDGNIKIIPIEGVIADKSLKRTRYEFDYSIPDYEIMIKDLADWVKKHSDLYPFYNL